MTTQVRDEIRVLYVDGDSERATATARALEREEDLGGVETVASGREARQVLENEHVDCVVWGLSNPGDSDAFSTLRQSGDTRPNILFTDGEGYPAASEAFADGPGDWVERPSHPGDVTLLATRIRNVVAASRYAEQTDSLGDTESATSRALTPEKPDVGTGVFEAIPQPVVAGTITEDGRFPIAGVNTAFEDVFGYTADAAIGQDIVDVIVPAAGEERHEAFRNQVQQGEYVEADVQRLTTDGPREFLVNVIPDGTESGDIEGWYAWFRDTTERRERERQLRRYREIIEHQNDVSFIVTEDKQVGFVIDRMSQLLGHERDDLVGTPVEEVARNLTAEPDAPERILAAIDDVLAGESERSVVFTAQTEAVGDRVVDLRFTPYDPNGEVAGVVGTGRDITERRRHKRQLQQQKTKIEAIHEVAMDIERSRSADAVYERIIEAAESILEFDIAIVDAVEDDVLVSKAVSSDLSEGHYYEETPVDAEDNVAAEVYRTGESSVIDDLREHLVTPASNEFRAALTVPIGNFGVFQTVDRSVGAFDEDDCEMVELLVAHARARIAQIRRESQLRQQAEELKRKNERLDQFARIVSHDLRNPLNIAQGHLNLARDIDDGGEHFEEIGSALGRMEEMIDGLLDLAQEGKQVREKETIDLGAITEGAWQNVETGDATLVTQTDLTLQADRGRLEQLLENLFRNAIEHGTAQSAPSPPDADQLGATGDSQGSDGSNVTGDESLTVTVGDDADGFYVADDGPGIADAEGDRIFEQGYTTSENGTGFGLSIVQEVANAHDWNVTANESETGGARFDITGVET